MTSIETNTARDLHLVFKAPGGRVIQGRRGPGRRGAPASHRRRHNLDPDFVLGTDQLVTGDDCFFVATGITDGDLMRASATAPAGARPTRW